MTTGQMEVERTVEQEGAISGHCLDAPIEEAKLGILAEAKL